MDLGCGEGFFTLPAAGIVGNKGKVYALDVNPEAIKRLVKKAARLNLNNLLLQTGSGEDTVFCENCADIIFFGIVLHDFHNPSAVLGNARKMIKKEGKLVNLDWNKLDMEFGPPAAKRFSPEYAASLIEAAGFRVQNTESSDYFYLISALPD